MRLLRVAVPEGEGARVRALAEEVGIDTWSVVMQDQHSPQGVSRREMMDSEVPTPKAMEFVDRLMGMPWFDESKVTIALRQPRGIVNKKSPAELTWPLVIPTVEIVEELYQFSHVTLGMVVRTFIASLLLAYGMVHDKILIVISGLFFLPLLPTVLATSFGVLTGRWHLASRGLKALSVGIALILLGAICVGAVTEGPVLFNEHNPWYVSMAISVAVGIAAALAEVDNVGRRELIALAAVAQIAITPSWFGLHLLFGMPDEAASRLGTWLADVGLLLLAAGVTFAVLKVKSGRSQRAPSLRLSATT